MTLSCPSLLCTNSLLLLSVQQLGAAQAPSLSPPCKNRALLKYLRSCRSLEYQSVALSLIVLILTGYQFFCRKLSFWARKFKSFKIVAIMFVLLHGANAILFLVASYSGLRLAQQDCRLVVEYDWVDELPTSDYNGRVQFATHTSSRESNKILTKNGILI